MTICTWVYNLSCPLGICLIFFSMLDLSLDTWVIVEGWCCSSAVPKFGSLLVKGFINKDQTGNTLMSTIRYCVSSICNVLDFLLMNEAQRKFYVALKISCCLVPVILLQLGSCLQAYMRIPHLISRWVRHPCTILYPLIVSQLHLGWIWWGQ